MDHMKFFFDVIIGQNVCTDYERVRLLLTPFQINHINIKRKTQKYKLVTQKEHQIELRQQQQQITRDKHQKSDLCLGSMEVSMIAKEMDDTSNLNLRPSGRPQGIKTQINEMVDNPYAAQITLQFALNSYKELNECKRKNKINPYLNNALENLALFRQQLGDAKDEDFNIFGLELSEVESQNIDLSTDRVLPHNLRRSPQERSPRDRSDQP